MMSALVISAPSEVEVNKSTEFFIDITNTTNTNQNLKLNLFSTAQVETFSPNSIAANSTAKVKVIVFNKYDSYTELESKLEVYLGTEYQEKKIIFKFLDNSNADFLGTEFVNGANSFFSLIAINSFFTLGDYNFFEVSAITVLVLLILVLFVALVVRIVKRE